MELVDILMDQPNSAVLNALLHWYINYRRGMLKMSFI